MSRVLGFNKTRFPICGSKTGQKHRSDARLWKPCFLCELHFQGSQGPRVRNAQYVSFVML